jgi:hypothetical protein
MNFKILSQAAPFLRVVSHLPAKKTTISGRLDKFAVGYFLSIFSFRTYQKLETSYHYSLPQVGADRLHPHLKNPKSCKTSQYAEDKSMGHLEQISKIQEIFAT